MPGSEAVFIAIGAIGFLVLLLSLVFGEVFGHGADFEHGVELGHGVDLGHEVELGHGVDVTHSLPPGAEGSATADSDALSWLSLRVLAASMVGFGAVGFIAEDLGLPAALSWPLAAVGFLAVGGGTYFLILKPLGAQQYNSLTSRYAYIGRDAVVTLGILPGGTGQVTFHDRQGGRVTQTASSDLSDAVPKGAGVKIVALAPGGVVVHHNPLS